MVFFFLLSQMVKEWKPTTSDYHCRTNTMKFFLTRYLCKFKCRCWWVGPFWKKKLICNSQGLFLWQMSIIWLNKTTWCWSCRKTLCKYKCRCWWVGSFWGKTTICNSQGLFLWQMSMFFCGTNRKLIVGVAKSHISYSQGLFLWQKRSWKAGFLRPFLGWYTWRFLQDTKILLYAQRGWPSWEVYFCSSLFSKQDYSPTVIWWDLY